MLVLHNVRVVPSNVRKNKRTAEYNKSTIIFDVSTTQCEDGTIKCDVLVTWYSKLSTSGYRTPKKKGTVKLPILKYCIVDEDADEIGQLELQFASMNICKAKSATNVE